MNRFLRETWELWYWAMFCPSKLQQRMNDWARQENGDTDFYRHSSIVYKLAIFLPVSILHCSSQHTFGRHL